MKDREILLLGEERDILVGLVQYEIRHLASVRGEMIEKGIDCGGVNNRIARLQAIIKILTKDEED